jgi:Flp pilus assembly protein TadG
MSKAGQSLLEATMGLVIIVIIVVGLIDLAIVLYGVALNDSACRNAARAAAAGGTTEVNYRARVAIDQSGLRGCGNIISQPKIILPVEVNLTSQPTEYFDPETGKIVNPGGEITGTITVTTEVDINPFAADLIFLQRKPLAFISEQTFPIHYIVPSQVNKPTI